MTDHIVINVETGQYECQHCGATQSPPKMPVLINDMLAHMDMFTAAHKDCKAPSLPKWVDLTHEEIDAMWIEWIDAVCLDHKTWAQAIQAKLKEKNT